jgi:hypothetical protein
LLLAGDNVTEGTALCFDLVHAAALNLGRLLAGLFHFQKYGAALLEAQQVGYASQLIRPAVNLHDPPAALFCYPNNRGDD